MSCLRVGCLRVSCPKKSFLSQSVSLSCFVICLRRRRSHASPTLQFDSDEESNAGRRLSWRTWSSAVVGVVTLFVTMSGLLFYLFLMACRRALKNVRENINMAKSALKTAEDVFKRLDRQFHLWGWTVIKHKLQDLLKIALAFAVRVVTFACKQSSNRTYNFKVSSKFNQTLI